MLVAFGAIFVRLTVLQVSQAADLRDLAADQRLRTVDLPAQRGQILDRWGERLALSVPAKDVYADPRYVVDPWGTANRLAPLLGETVGELAVDLARDATFVYLARHVDLDVADRIAGFELPGIGFLDSIARVYPAGSLASQVLGFVGVDGEGLNGLELQYEDVLAGEPGERTQEIGPGGQPIVSGVDVQRAPVAGASIETTIDRQLQYQTQVALEEAVLRQGARGGTAIVMDPRTGEILAMASYPWFDPNAFVDSPPRTYRSRAMTDAFEPGSTNKVITAAAAIQERALPLDERLTVPWTLEVDEYTIHDSHPHPPLRLMLGDVIAQSSNIGAVLVARRVGSPVMADYLSRFGLGRTTGSGFPGESSGIVMPLQEWSAANLATMAYGQGIAATPLQMISVFSTIANDGRWMQPRLVRATIDADGTRHEGPAEDPRRVVSAETAEMVSRMLAYAVEHGTGSSAQVEGYQVAGKTGTARIPDPDGGYVVGEYIASFIGYLPAADPQVVIAVILDRPAQGYGGLAAAPLFQRVARAAISRLGIEPAAELPPPPHAIPVP
jgi:cell division protein FtsI (penicillin-binding protein 3)